jgi:dethiobiotin synthase
LAVVGTDTGVGKTVVSALLVARWAGELPIGYWKPVATGAREERDLDTVRSLLGVPLTAMPESYLLADPVSPHLASRREGIAIDPRRLVDAWHQRDRGRAWVVEGAGGVLVPLRDDGWLLADQLGLFALPALVVARSTLGTINHTLLTLEALRRRALAVAGVVMVGPPDRENRAAIERFGQVQVIAEVPRLAHLDRDTIARQAADFDPRGELRRWLEPTGEPTGGTSHGQ